MGALPANFGGAQVDTRLPFARLCELRRLSAFPFDDGYQSDSPPNPGSPWYLSTKLAIWDDVRYDYATVGRGTAMSGSGPYVSELPTTATAIQVTAPDSRPCPYVAWASLFAYNDGSAAVFGNRFAIGAHVRGVEAGFEVLVADELVTEWSAAGHHTFNLFGFGIVPPNQTYDIFVGWDNAGITGLPLYSATPNQELWATRQRFGVCTF